MAIVISVGSGKGGTGKSMISANLACLLARLGRRVCLVDLDLGGADLHVQFGLFEPPVTLTDFITRKVPDINGIIHTLETVHGLHLIVGTGDTLHTANLNYQQKQRLLRALTTIDTDILLLDTGAGTNFHVLDFFMAADIQICVVCPEPTAIVDFYRFLQLATIRKGLSSFLSGTEITTTLRERPFDSLEEVFTLAEQLQPGARDRVKQALEFFNPLLITNRAGNNARINQMKLRSLVSRYLGVFLPDLGEIPDDPAVSQALSHFLPVCEDAPESPAGRSLQHIAERLNKVVELYAEKRKTDLAKQQQQPSP